MHLDWTTLLSRLLEQLIRKVHGPYRDTDEDDDLNCGNTKIKMQIWSLQFWQSIWNCFSVAITTAMIIPSIKLSNNITRIIAFILLHEKFLQSDWLRAVIFQLNLKYLHVKITKTFAGSSINEWYFEIVVRNFTSR